MIKLEDIWLVELTHADGITRAQDVLCGASGPGTMTWPGDDPPLRRYPPSIVDPGNTEQHLFQPGATRGRGLLSRGVISLNNGSGKLDFLATRVCDDGELVVRRGPRRGRYPGAFPVQQRGRCLSVSFDGGLCLLSWADGAAGVMDRLLPGRLYGGSNVGPVGTDGGTEMAGQAVPEVFGDPGIRLPLPASNAAILLYQVSRRRVATLTDVQDNGVTLVVEAEEASLAALISASVTAGKARIFKGSATDGAYVKLGTPPVGDVTCRAAEADDLCTPAAVLRSLLMIGGQVPAGSIDGVSFAAAPSWRCGYYLSAAGATVTAGEAVDVVAESLPSGLMPGDDGVWRLVSAPFPAQQTVATLSAERHFGRDQKPIWEMNPETGGIPASEIRISYARNWAVADKDALSGSVSAADRERAAAEYLVHVEPRRADQPVHPLAKPLEIATTLTRLADVQALARSLRDWHCNYRIHCVAVLSVNVAGGIKPGDSVLVRARRFPSLGLPDGRPFLVTGRVDQRAASTVTLYLAG